MFDLLTKRLETTFSSLRSRGTLSEEDVTAALREIRRALLEADVALPVIKTLISQVQERAVGEELLKSIKPGEQVVKYVHDALLETLGQPEPFTLPNQKPAVILMCGLQGSGKTTTAAKLAKYLTEKEGKSVRLSSLDVYRPAAQEQLQTLANRINVPMVPIIAEEKPLDITQRSLTQAVEEGADVLILDTAGRLEIDETLMDELKQIKEISNPTATLLVVDALTGQSAVKTARAFQDEISLTGLAFTRVDGDGRGGAILSVKAETGVPIHFLGAGEAIEKLELYDPDRIANRILGQGDVVALVETMQAAVDEDDGAALQEKLLSGQKMDLNDLRKQLKMMQKMSKLGGGFGGLMGMIPGMGKMLKGIDTDKLNSEDTKKALKVKLAHQLAVIDSMTKKERTNPQILNAKRRIRIANGAGVNVATVNKLIKTHDQMNKLTKLLKSGKLPNMSF